MLVFARCGSAGFGAGSARGAVGGGTEIGRGVFDTTFTMFFVSTPHAGVRFGNDATSSELDGRGCPPGTTGGAGRFTAMLPLEVAGGRFDVRPSKNGSSSAIDPRSRGGAAPRVSVSLRPTCFAMIAR